jgi:hypothetical protein
MPRTWLAARAAANRRSESRFAQARSSGSTGSAWSRATSSRSALREIVRATWRALAAVEPPGRTNVVTGPWRPERASISFSRRSMCRWAIAGVGRGELGARASSAWTTNSSWPSRSTSARISPSDSGSSARVRPSQEPSSS